jgi:hypothetical protein
MAERTVWAFVFGRIELTDTVSRGVRLSLHEKRCKEFDFAPHNTSDVRRGREENSERGVGSFVMTWKEKLDTSHS